MKKGATRFPAIVQLAEPDKHYRLGFGKRTGKSNRPSHAQIANFASTAQAGYD